MALRFGNCNLFVPEPFRTTRDAFLDGRLMVRQPAEGFRSGLDAVFLAAACPAKNGDQILEAGCGAGVASLCLAARVPGAKVIGVEVDPDLADLARENIRQNDLAARCRVLTADIAAPRSELEALGLKREAYEHVIANPPFYGAGRARASGNERRTRAHIMEDGGLDMWLRFLAGSAKPGGTCTIIHTPQALPELLTAFEGRFGGLRLLPLHPKRNADAIRIIISGKKGSRAPLYLAPGIVLHEDDGRPSDAAVAILRGARELV